METKSKNQLLKLKKEEDLKSIPRKFNFDKEYETLLVFTDGACIPNPGKGGFSFIVVDPIANKALYAYSEADKHTTNNKMEMSAFTAAYKLLSKVKVKNVIFYSDSKYVIDSIEKKWALNWIKKNEVDRPNIDLWKLLLENKAKVSSKLTHKWIKGHSGIKYNELADLLAEKAIENINTNNIEDTNVIEYTLENYNDKKILLSLNSKEELIDKILEYENLLKLLKEKYNIIENVIF